MPPHNWESPVERSQREGPGSHGAQSMKSDLEAPAVGDFPHHINWALRLNIIAGFFGMFWISVPLGAPLPLMMQGLQASATQLGILSASWQIATIAQIPAAFLVERLRRRKTSWVIVCLCHRILWATPAVVPLLFPNQRDTWTVMIITGLSLSNFLANLGTASWLSWMADLVPAEIAGRFWAKRQSILSVALVVSTILFGSILDAHSPEHLLKGFQWVFGLCSVFGVADVIIHSFVREPEQPPRQTINGIGSRLNEPFKTRGFGRLAFVMGIWTCAQSIVGYTLALPGFFSMVHLRQDYGASHAQASWIFCCAAFGALLLTPRLGRWIDSDGAPAVFVRLIAVIPFTMLGWWGAPKGMLALGNQEVPMAIVYMAPVAMVQGGLLAGALLCQFRLTQMATCAQGRTVAMAIHWSGCGMGGCIGAMLAGAIQDRISLSWFDFLQGSWSAFDLLVLISALICWLFVLPFALSLRSQSFTPKQRISILSQIKSAQTG